MGLWERTGSRKICMHCVNVPRRTCTAGKIPNNWMGEITWPVGVSLPLSSAIPLLTQLTNEPSIHGGRDEAMHEHRGEASLFPGLLKFSAVHMHINTAKPVSTLYGH